ncbi:MAG: type II toxin-antitoxin system RelE/ParE family toxin [Chloroflexi bacterium]|jgi:mRNA interferase RelE/StbE|nr:type II toxin-antitoxin system RelE/ParE family toxin [Chloroflexota bacterium]
MAEEGLWNVVLTRQAEKAIQRLPRSILHRVDRVFQTLEENPIPTGSKKLSGHSDLYRIRVGDWRIVYVLDRTNKTVLVVKIAPRGDVYRNL